jgi:hypothetical protein
MPGMKLDPAASIIERIGGVPAVKAATGLHETTVHRWTYAKSQGGTGGRIPQDHIESLIAYARQNDIALDLSDFFPKAGEAA